MFHKLYPTKHPSAATPIRKQDSVVKFNRLIFGDAMLLNEFLKEHCKVQELEMNAGRQQKQFESALAKQEKTIARQ